jgi:hypothetical protein
MTIEYTHDGCCDVPSNPGTYNSLTGNAARNYPLSYQARLLSNANGFDEWSKVFCAICEWKSDRDCTDASQWRSNNESSGEAHKISRKNLEDLSMRYSKYFMTISYSTVPCGEHLCLQTSFLCGCNTGMYRDSTDEFFTQHFLKNRRRLFYAWGCPQRAQQFLLSTRVISMVSAEVGINSAWAPICYPTGCLLNDFVILWKQMNENS